MQEAIDIRSVYLAENACGDAASAEGFMPRRSVQSVHEFLSRSWGFVSVRQRESSR
jgi:hypothetical protein